jgi:hypothetical protein
VIDLSEFASSRNRFALAQIGNRSRSFHAQNGSNGSGARLDNKTFFSSLASCTSNNFWMQIMNSPPIKIRRSIVRIQMQQQLIYEVPIVITTATFKYSISSMWVTRSNDGGSLPVSAFAGSMNALRRLSVLPNCLFSDQHVHHVNGAPLW